MKVRDSGMPPQDFWETLLDVPHVLDAFGFGPTTGDVAELGCGYGTFTLPLAQRIRGTMHTIDIDAAMVAITAERATGAGVTNVKAEMRDVLAGGGFGTPAGSCDAALLFNILHAAEPVALLRAASAVVRPAVSSRSFTGEAMWSRLAVPHSTSGPAQNRSPPGPSKLASPPRTKRSCFRPGISV